MYMSYDEDRMLEQEYEEYMEREYEMYLELEAEKWAYENIIIPEYFENLQEAGEFGNFP